MIEVRNQEFACGKNHQQCLAYVTVGPNDYNFQLKFTHPLCLKHFVTLWSLWLSQDIQLYAEGSLLYTYLVIQTVVFLNSFSVERRQKVLYTQQYRSQQPKLVPAIHANNDLHHQITSSELQTVYWQLLVTGNSLPVPAKDITEQ